MPVTRPGAGVEWQIVFGHTEGILCSFPKSESLGIHAIIPSRLALRYSENSVFS